MIIIICFNDLICFTWLCNELNIYIYKYTLWRIIVQSIEERSMRTFTLIKGLISFIRFQTGWKIGWPKTLFSNFIEPLRLLTCTLISQYAYAI